MEIKRLSRGVLSADPLILIKIHNFLSKTEPELRKYHTSGQIKIFRENISLEFLRNVVLAKGKPIFYYGKFPASFHVYCAENEGIISAAMMVWDFDEFSWKNSFIELISVEKDSRKRGLAKKLLEASEHEAFFRFNRQTIFAMVHKDNTSSNYLFAKMGYSKKCPLNPQLKSFYLYYKEKQ